MKKSSKDIDSSLVARAAVIELIVTGNWVQERLTEALKPFNISIPQFNVLRILRGQKGKPASLSCISEKMIHKMSNTTRLVDKLLQKSLVDRIICPNNRRKVEITITAKGLELLTELDRVVDTTQSGLVESLEPQEMDQLTSLLNKMREEK